MRQKTKYVTRAKAFLVQKTLVRKSRYTTYAVLCAANRYLYHTLARCHMRRMNNAIYRYYHWMLEYFLKVRPHLKLSRLKWALHTVKTCGSRRRTWPAFQHEQHVDTLRDCVNNLSSHYNFRIVSFSTWWTLCTCIIHTRLGIFSPKSWTS